MSVRKQTSTNSINVAQLQKELGDLKNAAIEANKTVAVEANATESIAANSANGVAAEGAEEAPSAPSFDSLTGTEQAAASLGINPDSWRPIGFMNVRAALNAGFRRAQADEYACERACVCNRMLTTTR